MRKRKRREEMRGNTKKRKEKKNDLRKMKVKGNRGTERREKKK